MKNPHNHEWKFAFEVCKKNEKVTWAYKCKNCNKWKVEYDGEQIKKFILFHRIFHYIKKHIKEHPNLHWFLFCLTILLFSMLLITTTFIILK